ncbi:MAG: hypothetical protein Q9163_004234 [Psora crenata]
MPSDDVKTYATSSTDFYALLGITFETSQKDIDRAWRRTALKYHPDKVGADPVAKEKFHLAQIGYDLLSEPSSKAIYDNARNARLQRQRQNELFEGRRRQMKEDLEARERGVKRPRDERETWEGEGEDEEEKLEREIRRLAEDGKRRRKEREEIARKRMMEGDAGLAEDDVFINTARPPPINPQASHPTSGRQVRGGGGVADIDRTVKVRWPVDGPGASVTAEHVKEVFAKFGIIESADLLSAKMARLGKGEQKQTAMTTKKRNKKQLVGTCMITYASIVGAHAAVEDFGKQRGPEWDIFDSTSWAADREPEVLDSAAVHAGSDSTTLKPSKEETAARSDRLPAATEGSPQAHANGVGKKPSFASFSAAASGTPKGSPFGKGMGPNSPSLEEMTMIRLRKLEQKRLAAEIQRQDEETDAAAKAPPGTS